MERVIVSFRQDDVGDWVAVLDCSHGQHVRLRAEKHGKLNLTRPEWVADFKREAFWLAIDKAARGIMAEQGEST